jgi:phage terminase small subunit
MALSQKRELFAVELATGVDSSGGPISQAEAYRRVYSTSGMADKTVWENASRLAADSKVSARIAELRGAVTAKAVVDASYVLNRLVEIDRMDALDILNDDGTVKPIKEWPKIWRQFISNMEVVEMAGGDDEKRVAVLKKIKWPDKVKNLELLGKHLQVGAFVEKVDHTSSDGSMTPKAANFVIGDEAIKSLADKLVN